MLIEKLKKLHILAFNDSEFYVDFFFKKRYLPKNTFIKFDHDNNPIGVVYARMLCLKLFDKEVTFPFFTGIATHPDHRHKGIAKSLVDEASKHYESLDYPFVMLHPFNEEFYNKLDFEAINFIKKLPICHKSDPLITYKMIDSDDIDDIIFLYNHHLSTKNAYVKRDIKEFNDILQSFTQDDDLGFLIFKNGILNGYVLCEDQKVIEYVGEDDLTLCAIKELDGFTYYKPTDKGISYSMARVTSMIQLLKLAPLKKDANGTFNFKVDDVCYKMIVKDGVLISIKETNEPSSFNLTKRQLASITLGNCYKDKINDDFMMFKNIFPCYNITMYERY